MAKRKIYHVKKTDAGWQARLRGAKIASVAGKTKEEVIQKVIVMARNHGKSVIKIYRKDGKIQEEREYN